MPPARLSAPAALRNRDAIMEVLRACLPASGEVLEIASGSGEHIVHFAAALPHIVFQPSDLDAESLQSIAGWTTEAGLANVLAPVRLNAAEPPWPVARAAAIICINMVHIAPWAATVGLMTGARMCLQPAGLLYLYGPFRVADVPTAASNESFDQLLRSRNSAWGIRELSAVADLAAEHGFSAPEITRMPANNLSLVFRLV